MEENNIEEPVIKTEKSKKLNNKIKFESKGEKETIVDFYNSKIKKIHIVVSIITLIFYVIMFVVSVRTPENYVNNVAATLKSQTNYIGLFTFLMLFTGTVPYFFLAFLGELEVLYIIGDFGTRLALEKSLGVSLFVGGAINMIGLALSMALGFYGCYLTTKRRKYYNASQFSMADIKMHYYLLRKDDKKAEEYENKKLEKAKKAENNNVKIPYLNIIILGVVSFVIQMIGLLISKI